MASWMGCGGPRPGVGNAAMVAPWFAGMYLSFGSPPYPPAHLGLGSRSPLGIRLHSCNLKYWGSKGFLVFASPARVPLVSAVINVAYRHRAGVWLLQDGPSACLLLLLEWGSFPPQKALHRRGRTEEWCWGKETVVKEMCEHVIMVLERLESCILLPLMISDYFFLT